MIPKELLFILAGLLVIAAAPIPYHGFYVFLRITAFIVFAMMAWERSKQARVANAWRWGLAAAIFNPFIPIHLPKGAWMWIDLAFAIAVSYAGLKQKEFSKLHE